MVWNIRAGGPGTTRDYQERGKYEWCSWLSSWLCPPQILSCLTWQKVSYYCCLSYCNLSGLLLLLLLVRQVEMTGVDVHDATWHCTEVWGRTWSPALGCPEPLEMLLRTWTHPGCWPVVGADVPRTLQQVIRPAVYLKASQLAQDACIYAAELISSATRALRPRTHGEWSTTMTPWSTSRVQVHRKSIRTLMVTLP